MNKTLTQENENKYKLHMQLAKAAKDYYLTVAKLDRMPCDVEQWEQHEWARFFINRCIQNWYTYGHFLYSMADTPEDQVVYDSLAHPEIKSDI